MQAGATPKEYNVQVDSKKRVTIQGAHQASYRVIHRKDGTILLKPRGSESSPAVSARTLRGMDAAIKNLRAGKRSKPVDLKKLASMDI